MNTTTSIWKGYAVMIVAIAVGVAISMAIDVQLSLANIDMSNPESLPNMDPQVRYYFIPIFSAVLAVCAVALNVVLQLIRHRRFTRLTHWALLGVAFSIASFVFPASHFLAASPVWLFVFSAIALAAALWVRSHFGLSDDEPTE